MIQHPVIARLADISIEFPVHDGGIATVVKGVSMTVHSGERIGLIGASGSGKSLTALSLLGLVPSPGAIVGGSVEVLGADLSTMALSEKQHLRGGTIGMVFQEAESALNPVLTIGAHLKEMIQRHRPTEGGTWRKIAVDLLKRVDLEPVRTLKSHPHRLSGGQRQRALMAIALAAKPELMIADEPTSSLDVLTQARLLTLLDRLCRDEGVALILISHDLGVVASLVDRVIVMLAGKIVEEAPIHEFLAKPLHPYSQSLVTPADITTRHEANQGSEVPFQHGCSLAGRCPLSTAECKKNPPPLVPISAGRTIRCPVVAAEVDP